MLKTDLHLHTADDPVDNIRHNATALVDRAAELGYAALAISLHDRQITNPYLCDYARERGIVLLPGIERTVAGRHVLLINFPPRVAQARTFDEIAALKAACNGLVVAPHPYFPGFSPLRSLMDRHAALFDAVEWSYFWTNGINFNAPAAQWAARHGKPLVGNSDLHDLRQLGRTYSVIEADRDADAICTAIRAGRVTLHTEPVPPIELARVLGGMAVRGRKAPDPALVNDDVDRGRSGAADRVVLNHVDALNKIG